ncbi:MAG: hypothetical protein KJ725_19060 [Gammaproteobacteria bacterium]|nr:hypothetical protein [Gammaproteobacteria bacterium]
MPDKLLLTAGVMGIAVAKALPTETGAVYSCLLPAILIASGCWGVYQKKGRLSCAV